MFEANSMAAAKEPQEKNGEFMEHGLEKTLHHIQLIYAYVNLLIDHGYMQALNNL